MWPTFKQTILMVADNGLKSLSGRREERKGKEMGKSEQVRDLELYSGRQVHKNKDTDRQSVIKW